MDQYAKGDCTAAAIGRGGARDSGAAGGGGSAAVAAGSGTAGRGGGSGDADTGGAAVTGAAEPSRSAVPRSETAFSAAMRLTRSLMS